MQSNARVDPAWDWDLADANLEWQRPKFGEPVLTLPRLGQAAFRLAVDEAYEYRCAVTGSRTYPSLSKRHTSATTPTRREPMRYPTHCFYGPTSILSTTAATLESTPTSDFG
jgi:hypothetical protein